jgi:predicted Zn-dependent protease
LRIRTVIPFKIMLGWLLLVGVVLVASPAGDAWAQRGGLSLIRDAETETIIRGLAAPVFEAADLDPQAIEINLINDPQLNAFVAGGQRVFINTGLLLRVRTPNELIGVIAHETGHISGGHLARIQDELKSASTQMILAMLLGVAAGIAGQPEAGAGIMMGGQSMAQRAILQYSRTQESAADQAGILFLERTGQSGRGLVSFLELLGGQEMLMASRQDPYMRTHPVSIERVDALRRRVEQSRFRDVADPPANVEKLRRVQAKLTGFMEGLGATAAKYPERDQSIAARYARSIAYYRVQRLDRALPLIDALIADEPGNPYFLELKSQMLFENGRAAESVPPIEAAVKLVPDEPLLRLALGQAQLSLDDPALVKPAIANLEYAVRRDHENGALWQQLAMAYGRDNNRGMAAYASAERFLLQGNKRDARGQANIALRMLPQGSPGWLRAQDILVATEQDADKDRNLRDRRERR